jgi:hypothetical protein
MHNEHEAVRYMFGILTIKCNTSPEVVEQAPEHLDKFMTPSITDTMIRNWICSVCGETMLTLTRYEALGWGR